MPAPAETLLLVHASGMGAQAWGRVRSLLEQQGLAVLAPDLCGYGGVPWQESTDPVPRVDVERITALLRAQERPVHLVGHSYGGLVSLLAALEAPEKLRSLALLEPTAFHLLRQVGDEKGQAELLGIRERHGGFYDEATGGNEDWLEAFIDYWNRPGSFQRMSEPARQAQIRVGRKIFREVMGCWQMPIPVDAIRALPMSVRLVRGERTTVAAIHTLQHLQNLRPEAEQIVIPGAPHMFPLTHPAETAAVLRGRG